MTADSGTVFGLDLSDIHLGCRADSMDEAIEFVGGCLVERGSVSTPYVDGMKQRETVVSTYLGNGVALPHGVFESKEYIVSTGLAIVQYPDGVDWKQGTARIVVGLAAVGDDHVAVLAQLAEVLQDEELCELLSTTTDAELVHRYLTAVAAEEETMIETREVVITSSQGLHARPAAALVETMKGFDAKLSISVGSKTADCGSIMSVLALGAASGSTAVLQADGPEAVAATDAAVAILTSEED